MTANNDGSKMFQFGKYIGIVYPDVYFQFVSKLHREHPDLIQAMVLAKVKLEDGSARDFLNSIFETNVTPEVSMQEGYHIFMLALERRRLTKIAQQEIAKVAGEFAKPTQAGYRFRPEEEDSNPLFPTMEEMTDKGIK